MFEAPPAGLPLAPLGGLSAADEGLRLDGRDCPFGVLGRAEDCVAGDEPTERVFCLVGSAFRGLVCLALTSSL